MYKNTQIERNERVVLGQRACYNIRFIRCGICSRQTQLGDRRVSGRSEHEFCDISQQLLPQSGLVFAEKQKVAEILREVHVKLRDAVCD